MLVKQRSLLIKAGLCFEEEPRSKKENARRSTTHVREVGNSNNNKGKKVFELQQQKGKQ